MKVSNFLHVGMTVKDLDRTIAFYTRYFGFRLEMRGVFSEEFMGSHHELYRLPRGAFSDFCFLRSPDGMALEVFQFHPGAEAEEEKWNQPGYTHICLKVSDIFQTYEQMKAEGIEFFFAPDMRAVPEEHWVFLKDPDGNLIELQD